MKRFFLCWGCIIIFAIISQAFNTKEYYTKEYCLKLEFEEGSVNTSSLLYKSNWREEECEGEGGDFLCGLKIVITKGSPTLEQIVSRLEQAYTNNLYFFPVDLISVNNESGIYTIEIITHSRE